MMLVVSRKKVDSAVKYTGWLTLTKDWGDYLGENWLKCVCICIVFVSVFLSVFISEVKRKKKSTVSWQWQKAEVLTWGEVAERVQFENNEHSKCPQQWFCYNTHAKTISFVATHMQRQLQNVHTTCIWELLVCCQYWKPLQKKICKLPGKGEE